MIFFIWDITSSKYATNIKMNVYNKFNTGYKPKDVYGHNWNESQLTNLTQLPASQHVGPSKLSKPLDVTKVNLPLFNIKLSQADGVSRFFIISTTTLLWTRKKNFFLWSLSVSGVRLSTDHRCPGMGSVSAFTVLKRLWASRCMCSKEIYGLWLTRFLKLPAVPPVYVVGT